MYCKRCGTKQKEGHKFCPKCGMAYPVVELPKNEVHPVSSSVEQKQSQTPPPLNSQTFPSNGVGTITPPVNKQKPTPPTVDNLTDKVEDTFEQGKKFVKENVQPQLDKGIENLKSTDWKSKAKKVNDAILHFDVKKVKRQHWIYTGIGCVVLFIGGLFFSLFMFIACNSCGHSSSLGNIDDDVDIEAGPREICITLQAETERATGPQGRMGNLISSSGNYGFNYDEDCFYSDEIIVPSGKSWTYKDYEVRYIGGEGTVPDVRHYFMGYANERYKTYNCRNDSRNIPIFRGNDKIKIIVYRWDEGSPKTMDVKVYFVEKDDDLQVSN